MTESTSPLIVEAIEDLKEAREYLRSIKEEFGSDPELLTFYEPSAREMVRQYEIRLKNVVESESGLQLAVRQDEEPDVWIRLEGADFRNGSGPIDAVGTFLHKLNQASHKVSKLLFADTARFAPSFFDLVATADGSLKLGLSGANVVNTNTQQLEFELNDPWDQIKQVVGNREKALISLKLLVKALDQENEDSVSELQKDLSNPNDILKLFHYAMDLTPSIRSPIEGISFEVPMSFNEVMAIKVDKGTRKKLSERAKRFKQDTLYIEGRALIRQQDLDNDSLTARPLILEDNKQYDEVKCVVSPQGVTEGVSFLGKFVSVSGFLVFGTNNKPVRLEIDEIDFAEEESNDE